jgi:hypothetical protein
LRPPSERIVVQSVSAGQRGINASENGGSFYFRTPDASVTKAVVRLSASPGRVSPKGIFRSLTCSTP